MLRPFHDPATGPLRVIALLSGSGSNLRRILEHRARLAADRGRATFDVVGLFSDAWDSRAAEIGREHDLPVLIRDIGAWYSRRGLPRKDLDARREYDAETVRLLAPFEARAAAYAGYMSVATRPLVEAFLGINVHPADLSIETGGRRRFVGAHAVRDAIRAGETALRSTTHLVEAEVDGGRLLAVSPPTAVTIPAGADPPDRETLRRISAEHQERLKEGGDWVVFPRTLEWLADGRFAQDESGRLHFDGRPVPAGVRMESGEP
jgi:folate-dependent phosphoribosylglycinamide formyltransferase PurN